MIESPLRTHAELPEPAFLEESSPVGLFVTAAPKEGLEFLAEALGLHPTQDFRAIQAVKEETMEVLGMVGFDRWTENSAEMHIWLKSPIVLRALLWPAFHYLFEQNGRGVALGVVSSKNTRALSVDKSAGFVEVARLKDGKALGEDLVILELRKENCRWLKRPQRKAA